MNTIFDEQSPRSTADEVDCSAPSALPRKRRRITKTRGRHMKRKAPVQNRRKAGRRGMSGSRRKSMSHRTGSKSRGKKLCMRAGPATNNGYLNFMREFRRKNCGLLPQESFKKGAEEWKKMSPSSKAKFNRKAVQVARRNLKKKPRKSRKTC